jgi:type III pantothenate kinase
MLLTVDVGNTNITLGLFQGNEVFVTFRITTQAARTSDEYGSMIAEMLVRKGIKVKEVEDVIIASVVPKVMYSLNSGIIKYFGIQPIVVGVGTKTGIRINRTDPREVGADRIVDAVAAYELYGGPCIVIDFGTATTYDLISEQGTFEAGVTSPGIQISAKALWDGTAKLPEIEIRKPESILGKDTISSMQAGIVYGYIGQTEYIVNRMKEESGIKNIKVIATGGLGRVIYENTDCIDVYDNQLTLQGMRIIYEKNKKTYEDR